MSDIFELKINFSSIIFVNFFIRVVKGITLSLPVASLRSKHGWWSWKFRDSSWLEMRKGSLRVIFDLVVQIPDLGEIFFKNLVINLRYFFHGNKSIDKLTHPHINAFKLGILSFDSMLITKCLEEFRPSFPIPIKHKILINKMGNSKMQQHFFFDSLLSFRCQNDYLK